ncbi:DUF1109 domain-containing protein [Pseudomonas sp. RIT-PI-S]|uniref:DUF1109 domain-containing protein n=1 Tax=Pseudomonas sp. RIT-PI-S TaxID=3035295 RepID=UPI0021D992F0|nr:DUF1109 domain-containing protein [Pseudomonas sp. RIT-PI-S]
MNTDELISLLAAGDTAVDRLALRRRFTIALVAGGLGAVLLMATLYGVRADIAVVGRTPLFWAKVALPGSLALLGLWLASRLARPGMRGGAVWLALAVPLLLVWLGGALALANAPPDARLGLVLGHTWHTCALNITLLSVPTFAGVFWALRGLAPTHLRQAGAAGGLLAGATATVAYCLHCPEMDMPFWGVWYLLGMLVPTVTGAALGPRLLRW